MEDLNQEVDRIVAGIGSAPSDVIAILHAIQKRYHYLPEEALRRVCRTTRIRPADMAGVSRFYTQFRHSPVGRHMIRICNGTACHVKGAERVFESFHRELGLEGSEDTDRDGQFTLQKVACLGCCTLAPVVQIDQVTYGHVQPESVHGILHEFLHRPAGHGPPHGAPAEDPGGHGEIKIGLGSCCIAGGGEKVREELVRCLQESEAHPRVKRVGCVGICHRTPLIEIHPEKGPSVLYDRVRPEEVAGIVRRHYPPLSLPRRWKNRAVHYMERLLGDSGSAPDCRPPMDVRDPAVDAFLGRQEHIATEHLGQMDPLDLQDYLDHEGFRALRRALGEMAPEEVAECIRRSGLRGRGGAGFPTGEKWRVVRGSADPVRYVICNGDEGDPGAFRDRMILESYPFRVIEGMILAAYAVGAREGFFYIRAEYPLAVARVREAIRLCRQEGWLGENILGSGFSLDLAIREGAGAFVCGEETALIASVEGKRGTPRFRPPYPAHQGLWGHPTAVNNCETLAVVPWIIRNGAESFRTHGTEKSRGSKVFSLAGKIVRGGLIEVPLGITIREIVEDIGGGMEPGRRFKAVQIGGPSGGCLPAEMADTRVDYEELTGAGAMMGSGGLLVMDDTDCMVDIARYFLDFTCHQSCGKCTFCRIGTQHMLEILEDLCAGRAHRDDLQKLEEIARNTRQGSLCGLGKTAPNPVLTTLAYFRGEYEAHLRGKCPAGRCKALIRYSINGSCIGCTLCAQRCPADAIPIEPYRRHHIRQERCTKCDICREVCPAGAVEVG